MDLQLAIWYLNILSFKWICVSIKIIVYASGIIRYNDLYDKPAVFYSKVPANYKSKVQLLEFMMVYL